MDAGRELDAKVAERLGARVERDWPCEWVIDGWMTGEDRDTLAGQTPRGRDHCAVFDVDRPDLIDRIPDYSTDIAAAFQVVKRMAEHAPTRYKNLSLVAYCYNRAYATFDTHAFDEYDAETWAEANGENATAHAICLAALKALAANAPISDNTPSEATNV